MVRAHSSTVCFGRWKTENLRALPEWSDLKQSKDGRPRCQSTPYLVLLPRRSDSLSEHANVQPSWDETSLGLGRCQFGGVEIRTTGIVRRSTNMMNSIA